MFKWSLSASATAKARPSDIWKIWTDVSSWPEWDHGLEWSKLNGPFAAGTMGELKPKGYPPLKFILTHVEEGEGYSDVTSMPLTKISFTHSAEPMGEHIRITHHVTVSGLLAPILWFTLRKNLQKGLPVAVGCLANLAEERGR